MEARRIEFERVITNNVGIKLVLVERGQDLNQAVNCLFAEKCACHSIDHRSQCSSAPISDHGSSRSLGFQRGDAEIFVTGKQEGAAMSIVMTYLGIGEPTQEANRGTG